MKTSTLCMLMLAAALGACAKNGPAGFSEAALKASADAKAADPGPGAPTAANTRSTYLSLVTQMQQKGLWFASLAHIDALETQWGVSPESMLLRADALRQTAQPQSAASLYRQLLDTPAKASGHRGLGLIAAANADYGQAIERFEQAQRLVPTDAALISDLGYAYLKAGRTADARVPVMQAAQLRPDSPRVLANLALYLLTDGQQESAQAVMGDQRVPDGLRAAIVEEARILRGGRAATDTASITAPLALRTSTWTSTP